MKRVRLSELLGKTVIGEGSGARLGKVWDVRVKRQPARRDGRHGEEHWIVVGLVIRHTGALERIGLIKLRRRTATDRWLSGGDVIAWDRVVRVDPDAITVRR